jgi:hypothetical protein
LRDASGRLSQNCRKTRTCRKTAAASRSSFSVQIR